MFRTYIAIAALLCSMLSFGMNQGAENAESVLTLEEIYQELLEFEADANSLDSSDSFTARKVRRILTPARKLINKLSWYKSIKQENDAAWLAMSAEDQEKVEGMQSEVPQLYCTVIKQRIIVILNEAGFFEDDGRFDE